MKGEWKAEEVALLVQAKKKLRAKGLPVDADVKTICEAAGISRKTGYGWAEKLEQTFGGEQNHLQEEVASLRAENKELKRDNEDLRFENEGRKLAWKIHHVDELLREKKDITKSGTNKKR